jgi:glycosyltransferase involved in cell wall biosynthesis
MKKVLIIAYYFPPSGGPGVQRVLKNVKYLRNYGWEPIVLTVENGQFPAIDESLFKEIPQDTKVFRTKIFEPYDLYRKFTGKGKNVALDVNNIKKEGQKRSLTESIAEFIRATFFIPDARIGWKKYAVKEGLKIIESEGINAIYSSSPPYTCSLIAKELKCTTKLPWIAGLRDPWTDFLTTPKRWFLPKMIDKSMERSVFRNADFVECAWEGIKKDALIKYPTFDAEKFIHIPNGYDSADFPDVVYEKNEVFTITYTGSMYGRRNPQTLFNAINELLSESKIEKEKFKFRFIGRFGAEIEEMFELSGFKGQIEIISYMPHSESIKNLFLSDVLLLIVDESKESKEIVPGKVYEYLGVKKAILAIAPQKSAIAVLIKETNSGLIAHQDEIDLIKNNFLKFYNNFYNNKQLIDINEKAVDKYERKNSAQQLANLLNSIAR